MGHHVGYLITALVTGPPGAMFLFLSYYIRILLEAFSTDGGLPVELRAIFDPMLLSFFIIGIVLIIIGCVFLFVGLVEYRNRFKK